MSLPHAAAPPAPINLAVTNLTLSPRFIMIWQDWRKGIEQLERLEREVSQDTSREALEIHWETALVQEREIRQESSESLVERASRVFVERVFGGSAASRFEVPRGDSSSPANRSRQLSANWVARHRRRSPRVEMQENRFSRRPILFATERAQTIFERLGLRTLRLLKSTVTRRRMRYLYGETGQRTWAGSPLGPELPVTPGVTRPESTPAVHVYAPMHSAQGLLVAAGVTRSTSPPSAQVHAPPHSFQRPLDASRVTGRTSPTTQRVLRAERSDASRPTGHANRPAERIFREEKPVAPSPSPAPVPATPASVPQAAPIDIGKLDTLLWQRFEKRLRIERERRGRA